MSSSLCCSISLLACLRGELETICRSRAVLLLRVTQMTQVFAYPMSRRANPRFLCSMLSGCLECQISSESVLSTLSLHLGSGIPAVHSSAKLCSPLEASSSDPWRADFADYSWFTGCRSTSWPTAACQGKAPWRSASASSRLRIRMTH